MSSGRFTIDAVFRAVDRMTAPVQKMQRTVDKFSKSANFDSLAKGADKYMRAVNAAATTTAALGAAAAAGLAYAAKPGLEFDQQMANLGATSLQTRDQILDLEKQAMRLGASTKFSATEVAAGMEEMAK